MRFLLLLSLLLVSHFAAAEEPGEIVSISKDGEVRFYSGDFVLMVGERLGVVDSRNQTNRFVVVTKVTPPFTEARIDSVEIKPYEVIEVLRVGQRVKLEVGRQELKELAFFGGANAAQTSGAYGGTNYFLGVSLQGYFAGDWVWQVEFQADSLGKDPTGTEVRRSSYMAGVGREWNQFQGIAHLGVIDTMTIVSGSQPSVYVDPYTGVSYGPNGVQHDTKVGFLLELNRRFDLSSVTRNNKIGVSLSPRASYGRTFASTPFGGFFSYGVALGIRFD